MSRKEDGKAPRCRIEVLTTGRCGPASVTSQSVASPNTKSQPSSLKSSSLGIVAFFYDAADQRASEQASECSPLRGTIVSGCPIVKTYHPRPPKVPAGFQPTARTDRFFYLKRVYDGGKTFTRTRTYKTTPKERRKKERKNERRNPSSTELRGIAQENTRETLITFRN